MVVSVKNGLKHEKTSQIVSWNNLSSKYINDNQNFVKFFVCCQECFVTNHSRIKRYIPRRNLAVLLWKSFQ